MGIETKRFFTPGTFGLLTVAVVGLTFGVIRFITGLGATTHLSTSYPWGIWIAVDVASGVALAAGGFTTAALVNIFGRREYRVLERPALLTAWLGYAFVGVGLLFDLGRYYNIWHPMVHWQGNSVLFEVGMCVMFYLTVLTVEFSPVLIGGLLRLGEGRSGFAGMLRRIDGPLRTIRTLVRRVMPIFLVAGVVLSFMHQSSLGALLLIAPSKVSSLWWTPVLPILFLLSAIMVGFPMVIVESLLAGRAFGRKPEIDVLGGIARFVPFTLGAYALIKFGDLAYRLTLDDLVNRPGDTMALFAELAVGVVIPLVLFSMKSIRRSPPGLFLAAFLVVAGVIFNRINVFLVGYHPAFAEGGYFPAAGEIAVTVGLVAAIMLCYRFFAWFFPVIEGVEPGTSGPKAARSEPGTSALSTWIARGVSVLVLAAFVVLYVAVHTHGLESKDRMFQHRPVPETTSVAISDHEAWHPGEAVPFTETKVPKILHLRHPNLNRSLDDYEPVRFMHKAHAARLGGDCSRCHHRVREAESDRIGIRIDFTHLDRHRPVACSTCHQEPGEPDRLGRPGLKGAYHQLCIGCHEEEATGWPTPGIFTTAPTDCKACHRPWVPDHGPHVALAAPVEDPRDITARCLECHEEEGMEILHTAHWTWTGHSPNTVGHEHDVELGKRQVINNYCIHIRSNEPRCAQCHIGYGFTDDTFDFDDPRGIDCLICHDTTGTYAKAAPNGGLPAEGIDLARVVAEVGRPSRENCGKCHFYGGGGANVKHGDLEPALVEPSHEFDVHMGKHDMRCQDCHTTFEHRIAGQCVAIPASEGRVTCRQCHGDTPHALDAPLGAHLDAHTSTIACQTCHIPSFAKETPTKLIWDWSKAGQDLPEGKDAHGMSTFAKKKGTFVWGKDVNPCYGWYNGRHERVLPGDPIDPEGGTVLNRPAGSIRDPEARLSPFKCYQGIVPIDAELKTLAIPKLWKGFWKHFDWDRAVEEGMKENGMPYSGELGFARVDMYWGINHEVVPATKALRCADCHDSGAVTCSRCHGEDHDLDEEALAAPCYPDRAGKWIDFEKHGYSGDPAKIGGRFNKRPLRPQQAGETSR